jgi:hypothetical protein
MTSQNVCRWLAVGVTVLWLSACSHTPSADDIPPGAAFTTKILADDTKLFVYSQRFARRGPGNGDGGDGSDEAPDRGGSGRSEQMAKISLRGMQAMLAQNHYCRDSYVVLEQYDQHGSFFIRGECRDAANAADRSKFSP